MLKLIRSVLIALQLIYLAGCSEEPKEAPPTETKARDAVAVEEIVEPPKEDLAAKQEQLQADQLNQYLAEADALLSVSYQRLEKGEEDVARTSLQSAYGKIQQAQQVDASDQRVARALDSLGTKYLSMIEASADDRAYNRAQGFIDDSLAMDIDTADILAAKEQIGKDIMKKSRQFDRF